jgi:hypothetical protein
MKLGVGETRLKVTITQQALDSSEIRDRKLSGDERIKHPQNRAELCMQSNAWLFSSMVVSLEL